MKDIAAKIICFKNVPRFNDVGVAEIIGANSFKLEGLS
jgi:hypothetical protein